jgi:hypothetical protein
MVRGERHVYRFRSDFHPALAARGQAHKAADTSADKPENNRGLHHLATTALKEAVATRASDSQSESSGSPDSKPDEGSPTGIRLAADADLELAHTIKWERHSRRVAQPRAMQRDTRRIVLDQRTDPGSGVCRDPYPLADAGGPWSLSSERKEGKDNQQRQRRRGTKHGHYPSRDAPKLRPAGQAMVKRTITPPAAPRPGPRAPPATPARRSPGRRRPRPPA